MFKVMFFLYRRDGMDTDEFQRYSREVHMPLVRRVPGLRRYVVNHALANPAGAATPADAVAELSFDSQEAFGAAIASPQGQAALADQGNYVDPARTHFLVVEELAGV
ncbi:MAG TPA: EthD family reductase [Longimicrobium sp.]|nr:EthD family reductase [Longimicrobium sp.]